MALQRVSQEQSNHFVWSPQMWECRVEREIPGKWMQQLMVKHWSKRAAINLL